MKILPKRGADNITFHIEATNHAHALVQHIHHLGCKAGVAINPGTSLHQLDAVLPFVDLVLVMSVNPGAGGQSFIVETLLKTRELQRLREEKQFRYYIQMDGGINAETLPPPSRQARIFLLQALRFSPIITSTHS